MKLMFTICELNHRSGIRACFLCSAKESLSVLQIQYTLLSKSINTHLNNNVFFNSWIEQRSLRCSKFLILCYNVTLPCASLQTYMFLVSLHDPTSHHISHKIQIKHIKVCCFNVRKSEEIPDVYILLWNTGNHSTNAFYGSTKENRKIHTTDELTCCRKK